jgi:hypothetical protein
MTWFLDTDHRHRCRAAPAAAAPRRPHRPGLRHLQENAARHVADRARSAGSRHRLVGRRTVLRQAGLAEAAGLPATEAHGRGSPSSTRNARRCAPCPTTGTRPDPPRPAARSLGLHQGQGLPRHDHPQALRRAGVLRLRAFGGGPETVHALFGGRGVGHGAQLAGPGRTAAALRHRGTEGLLPAAPGQGPGDPGLRPDQPAGRLGCRLHPRPRHRLQGRVAGQGSDRHARHLGQALHHPGPDLHDPRAGLPPAGSRPPAR